MLIKINGIFAMSITLTPSSSVPTQQQHQYPHPFCVYIRISVICFLAAFIMKLIGMIL